MPSKKEIIKICRKQGLSVQDTKYVLRVRGAKGPSRKPTGHFNSVHDVIASRKMKWTVDSEARSTELPFALFCEFNPDVLGIYAQPHAKKVTYRNASGKKVTIMVTFDFLVVSINGVFLVECKKVKDLAKLTVDKPFLYTESNGIYRYGENSDTHISGEIPVKISTDRDYSPNFTRNCIYLFNYIDDYINNPIYIGVKISESIKRSGNRARLNELEGAFGQKGVIHALLNGDIFIEFDKDLLGNSEHTWVYYDKTYLNGLRHIKREFELISLSRLSDLNGKHNLWWGTENWEIIDVTHDSLTIRKDRRPVQIGKGELNELIRNQELYFQFSPSDSYANSLDKLSSHSPVAIEAAIHRLSIVRGNNLKAERKISSRTVRRWKALVKDSETQGIDPILALLPRDADKGNENCRLEPELVTVINEVIKDELLKPSPGSRYSAFGKLEDRCAVKNLECCSLKTFYQRVATIPEHSRILRQKGFKAAYALGPQPYEIDLNWDLPYHGDFFFEVAHVDHTPLEISLISALTGEVIKASLTLSLLIDGHTRNILAIYVSFERPSYRSTMMLLRECLRRYKRLPIFIATDKGSDFQSHYFSRLLANLGIHHRNRPTAQPRHGSVVERVFGITETEFVHTLEGNKQNQKLGRGLSPSHNPERFAALTPDEFYDALADYVYLQYPLKNRRSISERPSDRMQRSLSQFDDPPGIKVASEQGFYIATLPEPKEKDGFRTINKNQIEFRHITYRLSEQVHDYDGRKKKIKIKYNPYDLRYILARFSSGWKRLFTNDHLVRECYDKGIRFPHMEVMPRKTRDGQRYRNDPKTAAQSFTETLAKENHLLLEKQQQEIEAALPGTLPASEIFTFNFNAINTSNSSTIK